MNYVAYVFLIAIKLYTSFFLKNKLVKHLFTLDLCRVKVYSYSLLPCRYLYQYIDIYMNKIITCINKHRTLFNPYITVPITLFKV